MEGTEKSFTVFIDDDGNIKVKPTNMSSDEVTGVVFRLAAQIKQQLRV